MDNRTEHLDPVYEGDIDGDMTVKKLESVLNRLGIYGVDVKLSNHQGFKLEARVDHFSVPFKSSGYTLEGAFRALINDVVTCMGFRGDSVQPK